MIARDIHFIISDKRPEDLMVPDYLRTLGFHDIETEEDLVDFCYDAIQYGTSLQVPDSDLRLVRWELGDCIQVWMYLNPGNEVEAFFPFYTGTTSHPIVIDEIVTPEEEEEERGQVRITAWLMRGSRNGQNDKGSCGKAKDGKERSDYQEKQFRFSFFCVDAPLYQEELALSDHHRIQFIGLTRKPKLHRNEEAFERNKKDWGPGMDLTTRSVFPDGLLDMTPGNHSASSGPRPYAYITGVVRSVSMKRNPRTEEPFFHVRLDTVGMLLDALFAAEQVPSTPEEGSVVEGYFLLLGMKKERA